MHRPLRHARPLLRLRPGPPHRQTSKCSTPPSSPTHTTTPTTTTSTTSTSHQLPLSVAVPVGLMAGTISALTAVAHNAVVIPALLRATTMNAQRATGTAVACVTAATLVGGLTSLSEGRGDVVLAATLAVCSVAATGVGARLNQRLSNRTLCLVLGSGLLAGGPLTAISSSPVAATQSSDATLAGTTQSCPLPTTASSAATSAATSPPPATTLFPANLNDLRLLAASLATSLAAAPSNGTTPYAEALPVGLACGFLAGFTGLGGGMLMTSWLMLRTPLDQTNAVATCLIATPAMNAAATFAHVKLGNVMVRPALVIGLASCTATWAAVRYLVPVVPDVQLRQLFLVLVSATGLDLLRRTLRAAG